MKKNIFIILFSFISIFSQAQVWNKLGDGMIYSGGIHSLCEFQNKLYIGGGIILPVKSTTICTWNGIFLDTLPTTKRTQLGVPYSLEVYNEKLIVGGNFWWIGNSWSGTDTSNMTNTIGIAQWDGVSWTTVGNGLSAHGESVNILQHKNDLYIGGGFNATQSISGLNCMARWDGNNWHNVGTGVLGDYSQVNAMAVFNDDLYLGGYFIKAGGKAAYNIAGWDGTQYFDLDTGVLGEVYSMQVDTINNLLYVGGQIYHAGGNNGFALPCYVAKWDGYIWDSVGINPSMNSGGNGLTMYNNQLYAGNFGSSGQFQDTILTRFDGYQWHRVEGPYTTILAMEVYNNELIVGGGGFITTSGDTAWGVARYYAPPDTTSCIFIQPLIHAMPYGTKEVGDTIKITPPYHIQFYTNNKYASSWAWDFGDGNTANTREPAHTYTTPGTYNVTLEVIHPHNLSSQVCTLNVSKTITIIDNTAINETKPQKTEYLGQNIPNPFTNTTSIPYYVPAGSKGFLQITDTKGELIDEYALQQGRNKLEISMASYKAGVYFYSLVLDGKVAETKKMMIDK